MYRLNPKNEWEGQDIKMQGLFGMDQIYTGGINK